MVRSTPKRPLDLEAHFPELAGYARTATRLHPRAGAPNVYESSVGGPLLWPADEPWPMCPDPHGEFWSDPSDLPTVAGIRRARASRAAAIERARQDGSVAVTTTAEEWEQNLHAPTGPASAEVSGGIALVPIAQLYARDIPDLKAPRGTDVLQVLWCPFDHSTHESEGPAVTLRWRDSSAIRRVLDEAPEPVFLEEPDYLPEPCILHPEQVTEYPTAVHLCYGLDRELCQRIAAWCRERAGTGPRDDDREPPSNDADAYDEMSACGTWKVGGLPFWSNRDPWRVCCADCGAEMSPLLQIGSGEWFDDLGYWVPLEDLPEILAVPLKPHFTGNPPQVSLPDGFRLQIFICPDSSDHPHRRYLL